MKRVARFFTIQTILLVFCLQYTVNLDLLWANQNHMSAHIHQQVNDIEQFKASF